MGRPSGCGHPVLVQVPHSGVVLNPASVASIVTFSGVVAPQGPGGMTSSPEPPKPLSRAHTHPVPPVSVQVPAAMSVPTM